MFQSWRPQFLDYLYISVTNAINFASADTVPMTRQAKLLINSSPRCTAHSKQVSWERKIMQTRGEQYWNFLSISGTLF